MRNILFNVIAIIGIVSLAYWLINMFKTTIIIIKLKRKNEQISSSVKQGYLQPFIEISRGGNTKKQIWKRVLAVFMACSMIFGIIWGFFPGLLTNTQIGSFFEGNNYTALYEANLQSEDDNLQKYDVVVEIERKSNSDEDGTYSEYYLRKAYFNKRQFISFNEHSDYNIVELDQQRHVTADNDKEYYVKLSNQQVHEIPD
jgi:hypothetical protein